MTNRESVFEGQPLRRLKANLLHPTTIDLMTANGACGSFSIVLARLYRWLWFPVRIAQMKANGIYAAHNIVEVKTNHGWAVVDPLFDVYFENQEGNLPVLRMYKPTGNITGQQLPDGYDSNYRMPACAIPIGRRFRSSFLRLKKCWT